MPRGLKKLKTLGISLIRKPFRNNIKTTIMKKKEKKEKQKEGLRLVIYLVIEALVVIVAVCFGISGTRKAAKEKARADNAEKERDDLKKQRDNLKTKVENLQEENEVLVGENNNLQGRVEILTNMNKGQERRLQIETYEHGKLVRERELLNKNN